MNVHKAIFFSSISVYGPCKAPTTDDARLYQETPYGIRTVVVPEGLARVGVGTVRLAEAHNPAAERTFHQGRIDKLVSSTDIVSETPPSLSFDSRLSMRSAIEAWLNGTDSHEVP